MGRVLYPKLQDGVWLRRQYEEQLRSTTEIAMGVGCTAAAVSAALYRHEIKPRPRNAPHGIGRRRRTRARRDVISQAAIDRQNEVKHVEELPVRLKRLVLAERGGTTAELRRALLEMAALCESWAQLLPQKREEIVALRPKRDPYTPVPSHQVPTPVAKRCECARRVLDEEGICVKCGGRP